MYLNPFILLIRFLTHLIHPFLGNRNQFNLRKYQFLYIINFIIWLLLIPIKFLEIFGFSYFLNFIFKLLTKQRSLTEYEKTELNSIFKNSIDLTKIKINEFSKLATLGAKITHKKALGFVWINTINFSKPIHCHSNIKDMAWLVHEVVHVAQFNKLGLQYIFEALIAQHFGGYSFGGVTNLKSNSLNYYNLEQQADIIRLYYLYAIKNEVPSLFNPLINDLKKQKF